MALASQCISRPALRGLVADAIRAGGTDAGQQVFDISTLPAKIEDFPALVVSAPSERKDTNGTGAPQFFTIVMIAIEGRVESTDQGEAESAIELLMSQVERAVYCTPSVIEVVQRFEYAETHTIVSAGSERFIGEATMLIGCQIWQLFEPEGGDPFLEIDLSATDPAVQTGPGFKSTAPQ